MFARPAAPQSCVWSTAVSVIMDPTRLIIMKMNCVFGKWSGKAWMAWRTNETQKDIDTETKPGWNRNASLPRGPILWLRLRTAIARSTQRRTVCKASGSMLDAVTLSMRWVLRQKWARRKWYSVLMPSGVVPSSGKIQLSDQLNE